MVPLPMLTEVLQKDRVRGRAQWKDRLANWEKVLPEASKAVRVSILPLELLANDIAGLYLTSLLINHSGHFA